jgi:carboxylesterase type B
MQLLTSSDAGYNIGGSTTYDGSKFVSLSTGRVIYVQIQYRLGPYGFLASKEIKKEGVANAGLLDQRAALDWVQRNIHAFGGDPGKVTIWGGSAGGGSVTDQLIMYGGASNPPFRAAITGTYMCFLDQVLPLLTSAYFLPRVSILATLS